MLGALGQSFCSPTLSPPCPDHVKYQIVDAIRGHFAHRLRDGMPLAGRRVVALNTLSGVRIELEDGSWGLVRASSNKPELAVVCESPVSEAVMRRIFADIDAHLAAYPEIGAYNQALPEPQHT